MSAAFINLSGSEILLLLLPVIILIIVPAYLSPRRERGLTQVLWLVGIFFIPPFIGCCYLLKIFFFDRSDRALIKAGRHPSSS